MARESNFQLEILTNMMGTVTIRIINVYQLLFPTKEIGSYIRRLIRPELLSKCTLSLQAAWDDNLLMRLAKVITNESHVTEVGLDLEVDPNKIESIITGE